LGPDFVVLGPDFVVLGPFWGLSKGLSNKGSLYMIALVLGADLGGRVGGVRDLAWGGLGSGLGGPDLAWGAPKDRCNLD